MERFRCQEQEGGWTVEGDLKDAAGAAIPLSALTQATLSLFDAETYVPGSAAGIINSRNAQDVLNVNNVVVTNGHFIWTLQPADCPIVTARRQLERHRALFTFVGSGFSMPVEFEIEVLNLEKTI